MTIRTVRLPDVGEGIAEAELVSWSVAVGDAVTSDTVVAEVLTDKATVEIYAPVAGTIVFISGSPGEVLAVGSDFLGIEIGGDAEIIQPEVAEPEAAEPEVAEPEVAELEGGQPAVVQPDAIAASTTTVTASPAVRDRARRLGIDLAALAARSPDQPITHETLDLCLTSSQRPDRLQRQSTSIAAADETTAVIGLRRKISTKMTLAWAIPHITYVDEVDVTQLERLRKSLIVAHPEQPRLTILPFLMRAMVLAIGDQPHLNATFESESEPQVLITHAAVHIGIATQTSSGLIVAVVRNAQELDLWSTSLELGRVTAATKDGTAARDEVSGSTVTITSLGALGGLATTPIINHPEVAIVGVNRIQTRPVWDGATFVPRTMMNLSSSFDHRVVDGYDAAVFIQRIKTLLEEPSMLFVDLPRRRE